MLLFTKLVIQIKIKISLEMKRLKNLKKPYNPRIGVVIAGHFTIFF